MTKLTIGCVNSATKILGDRWTPQLVRCFLNEPALRFCQIQDRVKGINPRTLSSRLSDLERYGIVSKRPTPDSSRCEYKLTQKGQELAPILRDMQLWGERYNIN